MNNIYRLFDKIQNGSNSIYNIDESTIYEPVNININNIKKTVFSEVENDMKKSRQNIKHKKILMIAAALASVTVISTSVAASIGGLENVFGQIFQGNLKAENIYSGNNIKITTKDENLNVEVLGITGDENTVYTALKLTHKDNSSFVRSIDSDIGFHSTTEFKDINSTGDTVKIRYPQIKEDFTIRLDGEPTETNEYPYMNGFGKSGWGQWDYQEGEDISVLSVSPEITAIKVLAEDGGRTLKMYIKYVQSNIIPTNGTLKISCRALSEYVRTNILKTYEKTDSNSTEIYKDAEENFFKKGIDGEWVDKPDGTQDLVQIENEKIDVQFDISVGLDYISNVRKFRFTGKEAENIIMKLTDDTVKTEYAEVTVSPFGVNITGVSDKAEQCVIDEEKTKVIMKDGTEYGLVSVIEMSSSEKGFQKSNLDFINSEYRTKDTLEEFNLNSDLLMLDINEIQTVIINGTEIKVN